MTEIHQTTECADCGAQIDDDSGEPDMKKPCISCGSTRRIHNVSIMETLAVRDGFGLKAKRPGQKKPYVEDLSMPDYSRSRGKHVHRQRVINRDNDHYFEKITDYETGEVIHYCEEPLSQHKNHGSAKSKKSKQNG
jgi:hypothetical protein